MFVHFKDNICGPNFAYLVVQKNGCYGLVNEIGKIVVPCKYPGFASFSNADNNNLLDRGFLCVTDGNKYGLIEIANSNQYLLNCVYDRIVFHSNKQYIWQDFLYAADNRYIVGYSAKSCTVFDVLSRQFLPSMSWYITLKLFSIIILLLFQSTLKQMTL